MCSHQPFPDCAQGRGRRPPRLTKWDERRSLGFTAGAEPGLAFLSTCQVARVKVVYSVLGRAWTGGLWLVYCCCVSCMRILVNPRLPFVLGEGVHIAYDITMSLICTSGVF